MKEDPLWSDSSAGYGANYQQHLLEQYKLYVEMTDRVSARRAIVHNFLLSVNALLLSGFGVLASDEGLDVAEYAIPVAGIFVCIVWYILIRTYRNIIDKKLAVVRSFEQHLPTAPFTVEREKLERADRRDYLLLTYVEPFIPLIFVVLYLTFMGAAGVEAIT